MILITFAELLIWKRKRVIYGPDGIKRTDHPCGTEGKQDARSEGYSTIKIGGLNFGQRVFAILFLGNFGIFVCVHAIDLDEGISG